MDKNKFLYDSEIFQGKQLDFKQIFDKVKRFVIFTDIDSEDVCRVEMMNVSGRVFFDCKSHSQFEEIVHLKLFKPVESGSTKSLKELI